MYVIEANAVMIATGGAAGLYKPTTPLLPPQDVVSA